MEREGGDQGKGSIFLCVLWGLKAAYDVKKYGGKQMDRNQLDLSVPQKTYACQSVFKGKSKQEIRTKYIQIMGSYIRQQEQNKYV